LVTIKSLPPVTVPIVASIDNVKVANVGDVKTVRNCPAESVEPVESENVPVDGVPPWL
jgi:hypothetical protein